MYSRLVGISCVCRRRCTEEKCKTDTME